MAIIRVVHNKDNPYVVMNKTGLNDPRLSYKAKGLHAYLLSKPDDWEVYVGHLAKQATDGKSAVRSGLKELIECGYAVFKRETDDRGRYTSGTYTVYEVPHCTFPNVDKPNKEKPDILSNDSPASNDDTNIPPTADAGAPPPAPKPKRPPKKKPDRKPVPESVKVFRANAHRYPAKAWYADVDETVGTKEADLAFWGKIVKTWAGYGWNPTNVKGMLECYRERRIPVKRGSDNGRITTTERVELATGPGGPVTDEILAEFGLLDD